VELSKWQNALHLRKLYELRRWMGGWGVELERPVARDRPSVRKFRPPRKKISRVVATFRVIFFRVPTTK